MEYTGSGNNRIVKVNGVSYLMPKNVDYYCQKGARVTYTRMQARFGSCQVNGVMVGRGIVVVAHSKIGTTMENVLIMR